ncbi:MAG: DUF819 family protein, partial [Gammaproteobacteria bacterium]|nr:DUF819 family protein [Gammaproteobacteria bacterium]
MRSPNQTALRCAGRRMRWPRGSWRRCSPRAMRPAMRSSGKLRAATGGAGASPPRAERDGAKACFNVADGSLLTLIGTDDVFALGAILVGLAWFGFWADGNRLGKTTSGVLWVIVGGMALSNFGVVPFKAPIYDFIGGSLVPLAIPLLLYNADLRRILRESGPVLITFGIACGGTVAGAVVGYHLIDLGEVGAKVAGAYTGGWTGGAVNFVAVATAVEMTPDEVSVAISANGVVSIMALVSLIALPSVALVRRLVPSRIMQDNEERANADAAADQPDKLHPSHVAGALGLSFAICAAAYA